MTKKPCFFPVDLSSTSFHLTSFLIPSFGTDNTQNQETKKVQFYTLLLDKIILVPIDSFENFFLLIGSRSNTSFHDLDCGHYKTPEAGAVLQTAFNA